jgi:endonuclease/exonuclease/phosphatase (EEP) superfamily protein YafD
VEQLIILPGNILMAGDFNFHIDNIGDSDTIKLNKILESFNLQQHVNGPTHKKGHTLDLIITRNEDKLVTGIRIHDPVISDHLAIHCTLQLEKPPLEQDLIDKYGNMLKEKQQHAPQKRRIINNSSSFITMV